MRVLLAVVLAVSATSLVFASRALPSVDVVANQAVANPATPDPCGVPQRARSFLASAGQLAGIEYLPSALLCRRSAARATTGIGLNPRAVADSLDRLVASDPRYQWAIQDGVVLVRPSEAWDASDHFLRKRVSSFVVNDMTLVGAANALGTLLAGFPITGDSIGVEEPTTQALRRFSLSLTDTTILAALSAIARQHGALLWEVNYCKPSAQYKFATISFSTFDGAGFGVHTATLDPNGRMQQGC